MQRKGALYTIVFSGIVCVVCSILVSTAAVALRPVQQVSMQLDRQKNILEAAGLRKAGQKMSRDEVIKLYGERVTPLVIDLKTGEPTDADPATFDPAREMKDPKTSTKAPPNPGQVARIPNRQIVYEIKNEQGEIDQVVLPIQGKGLWSTLYGFLALDRDGNTIRGITFYQHGETPGLGGEVDNPNWKARWLDRKAYNEQGEPAVTVIKGPAGDPASDPYHVDGISGATITGRGVSNFVHFWLGENGYKPFLEKFRNERS